MSPDPLDSAASEVLARYDAPVRRREALGNAGGFSGARLWRVACTDGDWCLKAWPPDAERHDRLIQVHALMRAARAVGLDFVPEVRRARDGSTVQLVAGRTWDLCQWMPGAAPPPAKVSRDNVSAACGALAQLHVVWSRVERRNGPCAAVSRRFDRLAEWEVATASGWRPAFGDTEDDLVAPLARKTWQLLPPCLALVRRLLEPVRDVPYRLQPCLGDVWHAHVLFTGSRVTGLIDYGAGRVDTPAADLARLLGSYAPTNDSLFGAGLLAYRAAAMLTDEEAQLVHILDYTGTLLSAANWLLWLYRDRRPFDDRAAVAARLAVLVERLERTHRRTLPLLR